MSAAQRDLVDRLLREAPFDLGGDVAEQRPLLDHMLTAQPLPADVRATEDQLGGVPVIRVDIDGVVAHGTILHIHGGGFALGSAASSVGLAAQLARRCEMRVVTVDYRLAPEYPYPGAQDDISAAYRALLKEAADAGEPNVSLSGESAGGNLALGLLLANREAGVPQPAAALLFSAMTDLTASGASFTKKAGVDPNLSRRAVIARVHDYLDGTGVDSADPRVSPVFADLHGLPPLLIQAGSHEVLLDDSIALAAKAAADDVPVILDVTAGTPHVFQAFAEVLDEGSEALDRAARFLRPHVDR